MEQNKTDLMMRFVLEGNPVWAECAMQVADDDTLMDDFTRSTDYDTYTNFFEVNDFDFGMSLKESDESTSALGQTARPMAAASGPAHHGAQGAGHGARGSGPSGAFARWRSATNAEYKKIYYPLEVDKFSFSRIIDSASPIFFQACCTSKTFDKAAIVKRLSRGDIDGEERLSAGYLRIDFTKVLITSIDWSDGDMVKEKIDFICQGFKIRYRRQSIDGSVSAKGELGAIWPNPTKDRSLNIRGGGRP